MVAKQILKHYQVFAGLTDAELEKLTSLAVEREYEAGAIVCQEQDNADELMVLEEGKIALQMTLPTTQMQLGKKITVDVVTKDEIVGWSVVVEPYVNTLSAICLQRAKVIAIKGTKLRALLQDNNHMGYEMLKELIKFIASRLDDTRHLLVSERLLATKEELGKGI
jgi:CRP/FNR family cyclic AMP-dependent transcriptional regulator